MCTSMGPLFSLLQFCTCHCQIVSSELFEFPKLEHFCPLNKKGDDRALEVLSRRQKAAWFHFTFLPSCIFTEVTLSLWREKGSLWNAVTHRPLWCWIQKSFYSHLSSSKGSLCHSAGSVFETATALGLLSAGTSQRKHCSFHFPSKRSSTLKECSLFPRFFTCLFIGQCQGSDQEFIVDSWD